MDTIIVAAGKIADKAIQLRQAPHPFETGQPTAAVQVAGYGGYYQDFQNGRIYSHHAVGTYEVHGGILKKFLTRNGIDVNPGMQRRELGFPASDQFLTPEGHAMNRFEWGEIIFFPGTNGGVAISGDIFRAWRTNGLEPYGYPITSNQRSGRYEFCLFERGMAIQVIGQPNIYWLRAYVPLLGNPGIVSLRNTTELPIYFSTIKATLTAIGENELATLINQQFLLQEVSNKLKFIPLFVNRLEDQSSMIGNNRIRIRMGCRVNVHVGQDNPAALYNIVAKNDNDDYSPVSPHSIYHRPDWKDFGLLHATDIHLARRHDILKPILREKLAQFPQYSQLIEGGIANLNNWNNGFRDFIRYANAMHRAGVVDGIMATGDVVDYLFEHKEFRDGGGNFKFFRDLILGYSPYPENENQVEELLVPIFVTLGNHDYRVEPYELFQRLDIPAYPDKDIPQFSNYNLLKDEARVIQGGDPSDFSDDDEGRVKVSVDNAKKQVVPATVMSYWNKDHLDYYRKYINYSNDYVVNLDHHKLIMIDSGPDLGAPDGNWDSVEGILTALGQGSVDQEAFQDRNSPNCVGPNDASFNNIKNVRAEDGVVIVGIHAPLINIFGHEYNHFFRETERQSADPLEIVSFLRRCNKEPFLLSSILPDVINPVSNTAGKAIAENLYPAWFTNGKHFKSGSPMEFLHEGVSRGNIDLFLRLLCGFEGSGKPVDLLLTGHDHVMSEMRVSVDDNGSLLYFTDFYTEKNLHYRNSLKYDGSFYHFSKVGITIANNVQPNGSVQIVDGLKQLRIPHYPDPLVDSTNKQDWWNRHKPLLIQGAPLGPTESNSRNLGTGVPEQPSNEGCKLIIVRNNVIDRIIQVSRKKLSNDNYELEPGVYGISFGTVGPNGEPPIEHEILHNI